MSRVSSVIVSVLLVGCGPNLSPAPAGGLPGARILEPGCPGSGLVTVGAALAAAVDGDVVEVCAGTYLERLVVSGKRLTLTARPDALVIIDAQGLGKGLSVTGGADVTVQGLTFRNGSGGNGGDLSCSASGLTLVDSHLEGGVATNGGGLYASECVGAVRGTAFEGNAAGSGGGAYVTGDLLAIEDNTFTRNTASSRGGGLRLRGDGPILDNLFLSNHSGDDAGAVYASEHDGFIEGNHVEGNTARQDGGGIYVEFGRPTVRWNTFLDNDAGDEGGGLRVKVASPTIVENTFESNHADYRGGGSKISHDEAVLVGNTWTGNTAGRGGALLLFESASTLTGETFVSNLADDGGAISIEAGWDGPLLQDSLFDSNVARNRGGHLYVSLPGETTRLRRVSLVRGSAGTGGAVYATGSDLDLRNVLIQRNTARAAAGGLRLVGTTGLVASSVAWANAGPDGAALSVVSGAALQVVDTTFGRHTAGTAVAVLSGAAPWVRYSSFNDNASNFSGMPNGIGVDGNLAVAPSFTAPSLGDFTLQAGSPLVDAGDPAISDLDGTRSDIGLHGGPYAE